MKKIFIICTVRNATEEYKKNLYEYAKKLEEKGNLVYLPPRDTNQEDNETGGYRICRDNLNAIRWADEIHVSYNPDSKGTHFDLGMSFALNKKIVLFEDLSNTNYTGKSFQNMIKYWQNICDDCLNGYSHVGYNFDECPTCKKNN